MSAEAAGTSRTQAMVTTSTKISFSVRETARRLRMRMQRSFLVVSSRMIGGWMTGTQRHVGVRRHRDRPQQVRRQLVGQEDRGRARRRRR